jgi:hypothetical protein
MGKLDSGQLIEFAEQVSYEKRMWDWSIDQLGTDVPKGAQHNAMSEVFVLHSRTLVEFFRSRRHLDDVIASDYVPDWRPDDDLRAMEKTLRSMNKRWMHLSASRLNDEGKERELDELRENSFRIHRTWDRFLGLLPTDTREAFERDITDAP